MIRRALIANRGEIALRVIGACRALGIKSVAVYSAVDADAPYVSAADEAVAIGGAAASESYLNIARIIEAARHTGADAIHPGYGFLSENAAFAGACAEAGITFVGPPADVIARAGSKTAARDAVRAAGVPVVPGGVPANQTDAAIASLLAEVGFPALLKAVAGGGGKGMRIVRTGAEAVEAIQMARREVAHAFGDGSLYVERLIDRPRHVEVQILADAHGHVAHLFERDCTLQRRHQKVVEESPAPTLAPSVRRRLTDAAVRAARAVGYVNAGTVEFLLDGRGDDAHFYFLEINTRLQVEHPVTEAVTGIDIVQAQFAIAAGEPLPFRQEDVKQTGHAIECRIYAEDSVQLLPQSGRLLRYREPAGDGIRVDSGVREGQAITVHYDPMIAKLIAHGASRDEALARLTGALGRFAILGVRHNIAFLLELMRHPDVRTNQTYTRFIEDHLGELARPAPVSLRRAAAAAAVWAASRSRVAQPPSDGTPASADPWQTLGRIEW